MYKKRNFKRILLKKKKDVKLKKRRLYVVRYVKSFKKNLNKKRLNEVLNEILNESKKFKKLQNNRKRLLKDVNNNYKFRKLKRLSYDQEKDQRKTLNEIHL